MTKKIVSLFLTLALLLVTIPALAATPSKTTNDLNQVTNTVEDYNVPLAGLFTIKSELTADAQKEYNAISSYVNNGQPAAGYFGNDNTALVLSEYVSLGINGYQASYGDVTASFGFATPYQDGQTIVVMFGYKDENGNIVWNQLNAKVVNGKVQIDFPSDLLLKAGTDAILAILS